MVGLETPLQVGVPVEVSTTEALHFDLADPEASLAIDVASFPSKLALTADVSRRRAPRYRRVHEIRQLNNRRELQSYEVERTDDTPMSWSLEAGEPHTRYALRWRLASLDLDGSDDR